MSIEHVSRRIMPSLNSAMASSPVVAITGPRTAGKSTLLADLSGRLGGTPVDLDEPAVRRLATADPTAFVRGLPEPIAIDEFQRVPDLLSAIKAELNRDRRPGRFVLAGSARHDAVPELTDFLTGRVELLRLWPFAMAELEPGVESIVDRLLSGKPPGRRTTGLDRPAVVAIVLRGGYPIAVGLPEEARSRWLTNLSELVVERVADDVPTVRNTATLARFLRLAGAGTGQLRNAADLGRDAGLGRDQAATYLRLLELVYLTIDLPAWSTSLSSRVIKRPKLYLADSGLAAHLQGVTSEHLAPTSPAGAARFGPLLETFVVTEIIKQLGWSRERARVFHYRTDEGIEVDLVIEAPDGRIAGIEVKAAGTTNASTTRGLAHLRDRLGDRFVAGLVLNTGSHTQQIGDRLHVAPIDELWRGS